MTTPSAREDNEQQWWKLLRRAFGIPDIVNTAHNEAAVTHALLEHVPPAQRPLGLPEQKSFDPHQQPGADAKAVLLAVVKMGGQGKLDELFVALGTAPRDRADLEHAVAEEAGRPETEGLVEALLETVTRYVAEHPVAD